MKTLMQFRIQRTLASLLLLVGCVALAGHVSPAAAQSTQPAPVPACSLAANAGNDIQAFQGAPLILDATLYHSNHASRSTLITPLLINAKNGSWANTFQLAVTNAAGATQNWPIRLIAPPTGTLTLDNTFEGDLTWVVDPSATSSILAGAYTVVAIIDTRSSAGNIGWSGVTTSDAVSIQIGPLPSSLSLDQQEEQVELLAMYDHLTGNDAKAISDLQAFLAQQPNDINVLELEGKLFEAMGQTDNALDAYDEAVGAFFVSTSGPISEPPAELSISQGNLRSVLFSQTVQTGAPQVSIQVVGQGTQSAGVNFLDLQITNSGNNDVAENISLNQVAILASSGTGQAGFNNVLSPRLPINTDVLEVNGSKTVRIFVSVQGTVGSLSLGVSGTAADIFGTLSAFSQTQSITLNSGGGGGGGTPVPLTITASNATRVFGQSNPTLNSVSYAGFVNGDGPVR